MKACQLDLIKLGETPDSPGAAEVAAWLNVESVRVQAVMGHSLFTDYYAYRRRMPSGNKHSKHRHYLRGYTESQGRMMAPNLYYFIMPREIYLKTQAWLDSLKYYGVLEAQHFGCLKKPRALHKEPANVHTVWAAAYNIAACKGFVQEKSSMHT